MLIYLGKLTLSKSTSLALTTVGGVLLAAAGLREQVASQLPGLPSVVFPISLYVGLAVAVVGAGSLGVKLIQWVLNRYVRPEYDHRASFHRELEIIHEFAEEQIGGEVTTLRQLRRIHNANREAIHVVQEVRENIGVRSTERFAGCFSIAPLRLSTREDLEEENLVGAELDEDDIAQNWRDAHAYYIGGVAARFRARPSTRAYLKSTVEHYVDVNPQPVFTRPVNAIGLQLCRRNGFEPVDETKEERTDILYVYRPDDDNDRV